MSENKKKKPKLGKTKNAWKTTNRRVSKSKW